MITVYGPNGEKKQVNARAIVKWLEQNPGWSLDNPQTPLIDESEETIEEINTALAGDTEKSQYKAPADISADILSQYETGIYYSGVPSVIQNPNWDGKTLEGKYVPAQAAYPGLSLIPSYEGDLYLSGPNFNPVNIGNMQELLEDAGYLTGAYNPGSNDAATKAAVRAWFNDVNGARFNSWVQGGNENIDPIKFLGNQINNKFTSELQQIKDYTQEMLQTVDRGKTLRDNLQKAIGNRRDFTTAELEAFKETMDGFINQEIKRNEEIAIFKLKEEYGKLPEPEKVKYIEGLDEAEASALEGALQKPITEPTPFSASEAFLAKVEPMYKSFREYPERQARADLNFENVNRSILGTSMRIA